MNKYTYMITFLNGRTLSLSAVASCATDAHIEIFDKLSNKEDVIRMDMIDVKTMDNK